MKPMNYDTTWALVKIAHHQNDFTTETPYIVRFRGDGYDAPAIAKWLVVNYLPYNQLVWCPDEQAAKFGDIKVEECHYQELTEAEALVMIKHLSCVTLTKNNLGGLKPA